MSAPWMADALRAGGCRVDEATVPNWQSRGTGGVFTPTGFLAHHTAGAASGNLPSLGIVRDGRSDLVGPLAQFMLARDGTCVMIAAGRANHAGAGSAPWVPSGDGNRYLIGCEAESTGTRDDWTPAQREAYPRAAAALLRFMGQPESHAIAHREWAPTRKVDPAFWDMNAFRADVRNWLNGAPAPRKGLFMALNEAEERDILEAARSVLFGKPGVRNAGQMARTVSELAEGTLSADEKALVVEVVGSLLRGLPGERSAGDLRINLAGMVEQVDLLEAKLCKMLEKLGCGDDESDESDDQAA